MAKPNPIPQGMSGFVPYLIVQNVDQAIEFYVKAFNGTKSTCLRMADGSVLHAEVRVGDTTIMMSEENEEWDMKSAKTLGGCPMTMTLYVEDVDSAAKVAEAAGMKVLRPIEDHFYGDRMAMFEDPYGYKWCLGSHVEDVPEEEMQKRMQEMYS